LPNEFWTQKTWETLPNESWTKSSKNLTKWVLNKRLRETLPNESWT
jgi:hypothetical protein